MAALWPRTERYFHLKLKLLIGWKIRLTSGFKLVCAFILLRAKYSLHLSICGEVLAEEASASAAKSRQKGCVCFVVEIED
ncbi:hypothetical protein HMPREF2537_05945 [Corynebacterium sp. HMSC074E01]|nr:hypothetical protein HMPREF2537_05945 [Corynebacterium sp. HMSC074E01]OFP61859.1 hypothetical protein HMPREF2978_01780 [Corynebacterium sp. HMSC074C01]